MKLANNLYFYLERGMLDCNTYVVTGDTIGIIIDPGATQFLPTKIADLRKDGIEPEDIKVIVNTHLHIDHCGADKAFREISGAKILSHPLQKKFRDVSVAETSRFFGLPPIEFKEDGLLENDRLDMGNLEIEFISSPGHSLDSICYYSKEGKFLVCGDVIFNGNTGRVDLPGGDATELKQSIERLSQLEIEFLLPGHMKYISDAKKVKDNFEFVRTRVFPWL